MNITYLRRLWRNSRGFTLVELMATIAVLALLAAIAIPLTGDIIADSKEKTRELSIKLIERSAENAYAAGETFDVEDGFSITKLIDEGYLDLDHEDPLVPESWAAQELHNENLFIYMGGPTPTDPSMFTWSPRGEGYAVTGFSDLRPDDLTDIVIPSRYEGLPVVRVGYATNAFADEGLTSVYLPRSITSINAGAFKNNELTEIRLPNAIIDIRHAAFENNNITSVKLPRSLEVLVSSAFANNEITTVRLDSEITTIGMRAFSNNNIKNLSIPGHVKDIDSSAFENNPIESLTLSEGIDDIDVYAFRNANLTSVKIPNSVRGIQMGAFANNYLSSVNFGTGVETIDNGAFSGNQIERVDLPASLRSLGQGVFTGSPVSEVILREGLESMGSAVFDKDSTYTEITIPKSVTDMHQNWNDSKDRTTYTLNVYDGSYAHLNHTFSDHQLNILPNE